MTKANELLGVFSIDEAKELNGVSIKKLLSELEKAQNMLDKSHAPIHNSSNPLYRDGRQQGKGVGGEKAKEAGKMISKAIALVSDAKGLLMQIQREE